MTRLVGYLAGLVAFAAIDAVWLTFVAGPMFAAELKGLLRASPDFGAAALFYLIYAVGLMVLAVQPALVARSAQVALLNGAVLGCTAYATFDLTCLAILEAWTWRLALPDIIWGTMLSGVAAWIAWLAASRWQAPTSQETLELRP